VLNVIIKKSPISIISPKCFQLNRRENGKHSSPIKEPSKKFKITVEGFDRPVNFHFNQKL
jgi:hypothetical protein